ncbi:MAG: FAD-dependent oxidoreductase, partial [Akkermansiaceae bacterium]|nr:FAD-dependent oxidoreductase [Akkermansiaceae bacterium]
MRHFLTCIAVGIIGGFNASAEVTETDICVYGGTASGVVTAVQAARMGKNVVLIEPSKFIGGMTSGGLG